MLRISVKYRVSRVKTHLENALFLGTSVMRSAFELSERLARLHYTNSPSHVPTYPTSPKNSAFVRCVLSIKQVDCKQRDNSFQDKEVRKRNRSIGRITQIHYRKERTYASLYRKTTGQADDIAKRYTPAGTDDVRV